MARIVVGSYPDPPPPAEVRDSDPRAPVVARLVAELIASRAPQVAAEHIGSTAIPGCAGKGIIDLLVEYPGNESIAIRAVLLDLGFQDYPRPDVFPRERPVLVGSVEHQGAVFLLHAHLTPADSHYAREQRRYLQRLRGDPQLVAAYVARKRAVLEAGITDPVDFSVAKSSFVVQRILGTDD